MSVFLPISKKGNAKECSDYCTIAVASHNSKVVLKICPARLQQYVSQELSDVQAGLRKYKGTRDQSANICWIMVKTREFHKSIYFCFIDYAKVFDYVRSVAQSCPTPCNPMDHSTPSFLIHYQLPELAQTQVHRVSDDIQPSHPLPSLSPVFPSIRVFSNELVLHIRWPEY